MGKKGPVLGEEGEDVDTRFHQEVLCEEVHRNRTLWFGRVVSLACSFRREEHFLHDVGFYAREKEIAIFPLIFDEERMGEESRSC